MHTQSESRAIFVSFHLRLIVSCFHLIAPIECFLASLMIYVPRLVLLFVLRTCQYTPQHVLRTFTRATTEAKEEEETTNHMLCISQRVLFIFCFRQ